MIIQCAKCQARFRLDDSRVTDKGVKVRCTRCKHVFRVHKEGADAEPFEPGAALAGFTASTSTGDMPPAAPLEERHTAAVFDFQGFEETPPGALPDDSSPFETAGFDDAAISFASDDAAVGEEKAPAATVETPAGGVEFDFSSFDFGGNDSIPDITPPSALPVDDFTFGTIEPAPPAPRKEALQGLDFSDDDMFGEVVQPAPEEPGETISFDFENDSFAESMGAGGQESSGKSGMLFSLDTPGDAPFSLDDIDFGDELTSVALQQVNPDDLKPSQEILFAPLAEAQEQSADAELIRSFMDGDSAGDQQELRPPSITSRRKQNPLFGALIAVAALLVVSVLGYIGYSSFSSGKGVVPEPGRISVQAVKAAFIENDAAGQLLVISGEAVNEYPKPRAALQVKVTVFDSAGQSIATKSAYCGNPLTAEQLKILPLDKIEAAMANQFGDSLANMEVAPGRAIPFVVVLAKLPVGVRDFGVQSVGSTVATGKP
ncbi:MAG: DUF3426 domain-containing protein [Desulfuromonadaceae bacterium]|nr:DUF3426 domain-containing protein [Desulfuromonadaceae bacterium]